MIKKLTLLFSLGFVFLIPTHAQDSDKLEFYGGYSYLRSSFNSDDSPLSYNQNGFEASAQYKFIPWLGIVADFSGGYGAGAPSTTYYLFGPQISLPGRISPFAHVLMGDGRVGEGFGNVASNSFAVAVGGGVDAKIAGHISWRIIQADWIHYNPHLAAEDNARISTGIVVRF